MSKPFIFVLDKSCYYLFILLLKTSIAGGNQVVQGFGEKFETFPSNYFSQNKPGKCVHDLLETKKLSFRP